MTSPPSYWWTRPLMMTKRWLGWIPTSRIVSPERKYAMSTLLRTSFCSSGPRLSKGDAEKLKALGMVTCECCGPGSDRSIAPPPLWPADDLRIVLRCLTTVEHAVVAHDAYSSQSRTLWCRGTRIEATCTDFVP